ncbi:acyl-CoA dehydrogenase [Nocardioides sp. GBK3QG-3]|uniref:Acyl-CoA dehydrogenase n=1 Tax=Nocardioides mangrovi TaxID=2874580 RepID=A0ABS7UCV3_9ACTN|nr:acyl-CoA dehydrogenase [Nocardioides mangrovi]MBZ5738811.1 acyl-CoA dehydrogenase [Nocardioides mangrovi]
MTQEPEEIEAVRSVVREALDRAIEREDAEEIGGEKTWAAFASAGLLGLPVPEAQGGEGLGLAAVAVLLDETGQRAIQLPVWETLCCGVLTIAAAGSEGQQALLAGVVGGETVLTPALREVGGAIPAEPATSYADGTVTGRKIGVTYADRASRLLVSATSADGPVVALVDPQGAGVELLESHSSFGTTQHTVVLDGAPAELLAGADAARVLRELAVAGLCLTAAGVVAGARDLTATYIKGRTQFGRSLAEFQAVAMQIADVYIASRTLDLAARNAAWRIAEGLDVADDLAVAAYWTCHEAPQAMRTCHHLHGGMGVDITYPMHRYFSWVTDISHALGAQAEDVHVESAASKNLELTEAQRALKAELRAYFGSLASENEHRDMALDRHGETYQRVVKQMGDDGWMGVGWPQEYGGHGLGEIEQTIFANEAQYSDVHLPAVTLQTVGPTLIRYGSEKQKDLFLKRILAGDVHFAIGYSEPDAGTDLASLRTTAKRDGDHYVVNGQKLWTTGGHQADYVWLACRTDPDAPKHKGISILIVDTTDPGYSFTPIITADRSHHVNATYYNDVRVPVDMLVGEENQGWKLITTQLNHERVMLGPAGRLEGLRDKVAEWATKAGVIDRPDVRRVMGEVTTVFRVNELLNWEVARAAAIGEISVGDASSSKVFAADQVQHLAADLVDIVHRYGDPADPETDALMTYLDGQSKRNLVLTFGGGVQEVQRELIAMFGLSLPRVPR